MNASSRSIRPHCAADSSSTHVAAALEEYLASIECGQPLSREELLSRHPLIRDELIPCLDSLDLLYQASLGFDSPDASIGAASKLPHLGDFRLIREIGRGGMGIVYEAEQLHLQRRVALKVLPFATLLDETQRARFNNEARLAAMLKHPRIVSIITVGCDRGVHYYAMELIEGIALSGVLQRIRARSALPLDDVLTMSRDRSSSALSDTLPAASLPTEYAGNRSSYHRRIAQIGIQASEALHFAHQQGVIHRDVKPGNLLLDNDGRLYVSDFGLARIQSDEHLTLSGDVVGTIRYMSPEQAAGRYVNERSDIYSLAATLYELLTLQPVISGANRNELLAAVTAAPTVPARNLDRTIPRDLETILIKAMSKESEERYETMAHFGDDLKRFLDSRAITARRSSFVSRGAKWSRRNYLVLSAILLCMITVSGLLAVGWHREARLRGVAERERREAQKVVERFQVPAIRIIRDHADAQTMKDFATEQITSLENLRLESETEGRSLLFGLATAHLSRSRANWYLGESSSSDPDFDRGVSILQAMLTRSPNDTLVLEKLRSAYWNHANHLAQDLRSKACLEAASRAGDIRVVDGAVYGYFLRIAGRLEEAEEWLRQACRRLDPLQTGSVMDSRTFQRTLIARGHLVFVILERGNFVEASRMLNDLLRNEHEWPKSPITEYWRLTAHRWLAEIDNAHMKAEKALGHSEKAIVPARAQLIKFPSDAFYKICLATLYIAHSDSLALLGRHAEAIEALNKSLTFLTGIQSAFTEVFRIRIRLRLGQAWRYFDLRESSDHFGAAIEIARRLAEVRRDEQFCVSHALLAEAVLRGSGAVNPTTGTSAIGIKLFEARPWASWKTDSGHFWRHVALAAYRSDRNDLAIRASDRALDCFQSEDTIDLVIRALVLADRGQIQAATENYYAALKHVQHGRPVLFRYVGPSFVQSLLEEAADVLQLERPPSLLMTALK